MFSGKRATSRARARWARRRMKPRSSRPVIRRCTPDFDLRPRDSFISSKEGQIPVSPRRLLMKSSSSCCFLVSIVSVSLYPARWSEGHPPGMEQNPNFDTCSSLVPGTRQGRVKRGNPLSAADRSGPSRGRRSSRPPACTRSRPSRDSQGYLSNQIDRGS